MITRYFLGFLLLTALAGCRDDNLTADTNAASNPVQVVSNTLPTISGTPAASTKAGGVYAFQPAVNDPNGDQLSFAIQNKPVWAAFNATTGALTGSPRTDQVGTFAGIVISVSDGLARAALPAFSIQVTAATQGPSIAGSPPTSVVIGNAYSFTPMASDPNGDALTFSIQNMPSWAAFDESTGQLSGTPGSGDVGTTSGIVISVGNGTTSAQLPAFSIAVNQSANGSATLSWLPPAQNTDGTPLTNLAGYHIYYGTNSASLNKSVRITNPSVSTYMVADLSPATWYFSVKAFTTLGVESDYSKKVSKMIQ